MTQCHFICTYVCLGRSILHHMWQVSVDSVDKCLEEAPLKKGSNSAQLHQRLFKTLQTMRDFYHCGGDGLDDKDLDTECYKVCDDHCQFVFFLDVKFLPN